MTTVTEKAYAKLNLTLDVLGKRADGYHDLQSVMQTVSLCDDIELDIGTGKDWCLKCTQPDIPADGRNLAWKAAKLFCDTLGKDPQGLEIRIGKRIPSGAGMGGGSADAAAVLRALNRFYGEPLSGTQLADLGARIGSDVPFCVLGGTAMAEGRGEILRPIPPMLDCTILGCKPEFSVSTPELYRKIDEVAIARHPDNQQMEAALNAGDLNGLARCVYNVFDPVVAAQHEEIDRIKQICNDCGALASQMTGSGSVVFAIFDDLSSARKAEDLLKKEFDQVFLCEPV